MNTVWFSICVSLDFANGSDCAVVVVIESAQLGPPAICLSRSQQTTGRGCNWAPSCACGPSCGSECGLMPHFKADGPQEHPEDERYRTLVQEVKTGPRDHSRLMAMTADPPPTPTPRFAKYRFVENVGNYLQSIMLFLVFLDN